MAIYVHRSAHVKEHTTASEVHANRGPYTTSAGGRKQPRDNRVTCEVVSDGTKERGGALTHEVCCKFICRLMLVGKTAAEQLLLRLRAEAAQLKAAGDSTDQDNLRAGCM